MMRGCLFLCACTLTGATAAEPIHGDIQHLLGRYCLDCHDADSAKGDLNLERFATVSDMAADSGVWEKVLDQIRDGEMPPKKKPQFTPEEQKQFTAWVNGTLEKIALAQAGDPGPVVLRRLSNHEYTYTLRDLTGVDSLDPAREFPIDGAAGEGFTNVGAALAMSPALLTKYLDAAKAVAAHAVLLPDGITFSPHTSRADWTRERLDAIRAIYDRYSTHAGVAEYKVQGIDVTSKEAGAIPLEAYLTALLDGDPAKAKGLSPKYLAILNAALESDAPSALLDPIRARWKTAKPEDIPAIAATIRHWQAGLWHFAKVGHIGKLNGPPSWQIAIHPVADSQEIQLTLPPSEEAKTLHLVATDAGDGAEGDTVLWRDAKLTLPDGVSFPVAQIETLQSAVARKQQTELQRSAAYLDAALAKKTPADHDPAIAAAWRAFLALDQKPVPIPTLLKDRFEEIKGQPALKKYGAGLPNVTVNTSETDVAPGTYRIPARGVTLHPSGTEDAVIVWKSPITGKVRIEGSAEKTDHGGNGVEWSVELIDAWGTRELTRRVLAKDGKAEYHSPHETSVHPGDIVRLTIDPHENNFICDTTAVALRITEAGGANRVWDLASDIVDHLGPSNPLPDSLGNVQVWHLCQEKRGKEAPFTFPADSTVDHWRSGVVRGEAPVPAASAQAAILHPQTDADQRVAAEILRWGGPFRWPEKVKLDAQVGDLELAAPSIEKIVIPAGLASAGAAFTATVSLKKDPKLQGSSATTLKGSAQVWATLSEPAADAPPLQPGQIATVGDSDGSSWSAGMAPVASDRPILIHSGSQSQGRFDRDIAEFQMLFPAALCYQRIVPIDEVVTLTLHHREDQYLRQLMLSEAEAAQLDRLWDEMRFVGNEPLLQLDAFNQLWQFATQDADPSRFEPMRDPLNRAVFAFKQRVLATEPAQVEAVINFATGAWRRPLKDGERAELRALYLKFRQEELDHEAASRQLLARILTAPDFLYRTETPGPGPRPTPLNDWEMASRLSYFLWSSAPDATLRARAAAGQLSDPDILAAETRRMIQDPKIRRLATEFGAQFLHVRDLETLEEKSERHFPTFLGLRADMQEEVVRFFIDLFQSDRPVMALLDSDHSFMNAPLAEHCGFTVKSGGWQRVDGLRARGRGGILGFSATLARQSGASRTSPILRGNWISEVILGEKLPRPPKNVPVLPDEAPKGLTERQLIERHSSDPSCARCHEKVDPLGFALEGFDAIGRARDGTDTHATLKDGTAFDGLSGLRDYLIQTRRDEFQRQFCRKLLGYALGRGVQLSDHPLIDAMVHDLNSGNDHVGGVIEKIVRSPQFRNLRGADFTQTSPD
ncbi:MAG: DUF1592 domain-containing protein [Verrucomicrobiales bacterium]|nr:DUF1592 domain-containing protein [Verrucomicrobiales bacterium]